MKKQLSIYSSITIIVLFIAFDIHAQNAPASESVSQPPAPAPQSHALKKQVINFEDELIEGSSQKPELFYLLQKKNFNYKRLIKLRENFLPEMKRSSEDIKRLRGGR